MKIIHLVSIGGEHYYWQEEAEQMYFKEQGLLVPIPPSYGSLTNHVQIETEEELDVESLKDL